MDFENKMPEWKNTGTEPSTELKNNGFFAGLKPPAGIFNWFWSLVSKAITELQTKFKSHTTAENPHGITAQKIGAASSKHSTQHSENGSDPIEPYNIGAISAKIGLVDGTKITFDSALKQGEYGVQATDTAGAPYTGMLYGKLIVTLSDGKEKNDSNWIWQEFLPASSSKQRCWRMKINTGDWTDWFVYYDTGHKPSAEDIADTIPVTKGGTGATTPSSAANNLGVYSLLSGTSISANTNMNDYKSVGNYVCGQSSIAGSLDNCPTYSAFTMKVYYANGSDWYIGQEVTDYSTGVKYYRVYNRNSDTWEDWKHNFTSAKKPTAADISAGMLGGRVMANSAASENLGNSQVRNISAGTEDLIAGTSSLGTGAIYIVYE